MQIFLVTRISRNDSIFLFGFNIKLLKTQLSKIVQSGGFLGPLMKVSLLLMKNVLKSLAKSVLIPLELTAATSAEDLVWFRNHNIDNFKRRNGSYHGNS